MTSPITGAADTDPEPPLGPTNPLARTARFLNYTFPRSYAGLSLLPRVVLALRWLRRLERAHAGRPLSDLPFERYRTSETVFVFGTGASINEYPKEWWEVVRDHDSIGMNFFLLHEHVPTFHVMEKVEEPRASLLAARYVDKGDYRGVPLIVKTQVTNLSWRRVTDRMNNLAALPPEVLSNTYLSVDLLAAGKTVQDLESSYQMLAKWGLWTPKPRFLVLTRQGGSLSYIMNLAVRAGYRRVVLCGIDLNHTEYFYDSRRRELEAEGLPVPPNRESGPVHSTNDPDQKRVTMHQIIMILKRTFLDPAGVELLVGSEKSALHPDLPRFDWEQAITMVRRRSG